MPYGNKTIGLALSGGGYRATLFGVGSLWRLNELGLLRALDRITSVSGGSILAGYLAYKWANLNFVDNVAQNLKQEIIDPLQTFCSHTIDIPSGLKGIFLPFRSASDFLESTYNKMLFKNAKIKDMPIGPGSPAVATGPDFIIYATNLQTGRSFRFTQEYVADYYLGVNRAANYDLATAVAASSGFPPVFSPIKIEANPKDWVDAKSDYPGLEQLQKKILLTDGGVYDNMGLQALIGNVEIVLVSDAGAPFKVKTSPMLNYVSQLGRVRDILIDQTRALRRNWFVQDLLDKKREGAYWGIGTQIGAYQVPTIVKDTPITNALRMIRTRLSNFSPKEQNQLINWGYALCDAAIRKYVISDAPAAATLPYPDDF